MSFTGGNSGGGGGRPQLYFCHQCNHSVTLTPPSNSSDLSCPTCHGGFLEELDSPTPNPNPNPFDFPFILDDLASILGPSQSGPVHRSSSSNQLFQDTDAFNPFVFLQNYLQTLRSDGANIQFVIENNSGGGGLDPSGFGGGAAFRLQANLGDYFVGPGLEQLIQQLAENDPNRYGTPPAAKSAIEALSDIKISEELLASDSSQCAVCKDTFELGEEGKQIPCKHIYHKDCIIPWLELHNSCPVCRYELPTDDPDYEQRMHGTVNSRDQTQRQNVGTGGSGDSGTGSGGNVDGTEENPDTPRTVERRLRISLPWPFRGFGAPAETSNSGSGNNDGDSNSGNHGSSDFRSETREEDLD
ncbi:hypothetical protein HS088_TW20G00763 [Tripterygium wilfordii]|uniref:RING-type E3 ubiquitin transferase n=1 Tax=Tripterygium wilfordii TaxID=458696 RepID=A0A7J7C8G0_TRIWF|nr:E3 ubiquitin-protein ligase RING1-like [Tripterygium wilfordii]KAF5730390.1 hypothetical protein HS088_TW20G00763 [Tripterygium wilfordii]